jgi:hypothetical protein
MLEAFHHGAILRIIRISRQIVRDERITNSAVGKKFLGMPTILNIVKKKVLKYIGKVVEQWQKQKILPSWKFMFLVRYT